MRYIKCFLLLIVLWGCVKQTGSLLSYEGLILAHRALVKNTFIYERQIHNEMMSDPKTVAPIMKKTDSLRAYTDTVIGYLNTSSEAFFRANGIDSVNLLKDDDLNKIIDIDKERVVLMLRNYKGLVRLFIEKDKRTEFIFSKVDSLLNVEEIEDMDMNLLNVAIVQNKIENVKYLLMRYFHSQVESDYFHPWLTTVNVQPYSQKLKKGEEYKAKILIADVDTNVSFTVFVKKNDGFITLPIEEKRAVFSENTEGFCGKQIREGYIEVERTFGQVEKLPFKLEYTVE